MINENLKWLLDKQIELRDEITHRKKIYFDTNVWIKLRDMVFGGKPEDQLKFDALTMSLDSHIYPISYATVLEVLKQGDGERRSVTSVVINVLSEGVCAPHIFERFFFECLHSLSNPTEILTQNSNKRLPIWVKGPFAFGRAFVRDLVKGVSSLSNGLVKVTEEDLWNHSIGEHIGGPEFNNRIPTSVAEVILAWNNQKSKPGHGYKSLKEAKIDFMDGAIVALKSVINECMLAKFELEGGKIPPELNVSEILKSNKTAKIISLGFKEGIYTFQFPTIGIWGHLHAILDRESGHNYQDNDYYDFEHVLTAASFCHVYVGERRFCSLLTKGNPSIAEIYDIKIYTNLDEYISAELNFP